MALTDEVSAGSDHSDRTLVVRTCLGDAEAFAELYARYRASLYHVCLRRLRDPSLAEDVVHETFERALNHLDSFDTRRRLFPWLVTIAQNACVDVVRSRSKLDLVAEHESDDEIVLDIHSAHDDVTSRAVLDSEARKQLGVALSALPARQRRVLMLYAIENWSYAQIADAEESTISSVKSLIFRARDQLRRACDKGLLVLAPISRLRVRARRHAADLHNGVPGAVGNGFLAMQGMLSSVVGMALALTSLGVSIVPPAAAHAQSLTAAHLTRREQRVTNVPATAPATAREKAKGPSSRGTSDDPLNHWLVGGGNDQPEKTLLSSLVVSPSYEQDGTLFATGRGTCPTCEHLFVSRDRGASWVRLAGQGFTGRSLLLSPTFDADNTIFAYGGAAVVMSTDGGASFTPVSVPSGSAAISPRLGAGDWTLLLSTDAGLLEYHDSTLFPAKYPVAGERDPTVAFSPTFASDRRVFIGNQEQELQGDYPHPVIIMCRELDCVRKEFPDSRYRPNFRFSSSYAQDRLIAAFSTESLLLSPDGGESWKALQVPWNSARESMTDVVVDGDTLYVTLSVPYDSPNPPLVISRDRGETWSFVRVPFKGVDQSLRGVEKLGATGPVIIHARGVACSADEGRTWSQRCS